MLSPVITVASYAACLVSIPFVLNASHLGYAIPYLARYFNVDFYVYNLEPIVLCLGLATFYIYVFLGFLLDILKAFERELMTVERRSFFAKMEQAHQELHKLFPRKDSCIKVDSIIHAVLIIAFVVSSLLMYVNTTRFDTLRNR
jgi:hypothetical protein